MPKTSHRPPEQYAALIAADGPKRLKHLLSQAADGGALWGLRDQSGWVSLADESGTPGFAVWPHPDYAQDCATDSWAGSLPAEIDVHEFVDDWLPDMLAQGVSIAAFPTPSMRGVWISAGELKLRLEEELAKYE
jgi:hypothetical protein